MAYEIIRICFIDSYRHFAYIPQNLIKTEKKIEALKPIVVSGFIFKIEISR